MHLRVSTSPCSRLMTYSITSYFDHTQMTPPQFQLDDGAGNPPVVSSLVLPLRVHA